VQKGRATVAHPRAVTEGHATLQLVDVDGKEVTRNATAEKRAQPAAPSADR